MTKDFTKPGQTYTTYHFKRVKHGASKWGDAGHYWKGSMTLVTDEWVEDEKEAERDLETLIRNNILPMFGHVDFLLVEINFDWYPSQSDRDKYGDSIICVVSVAYQSRVEPLTRDEQITRLKEMRHLLPDSLLTEFLGGQDES